MRRTLGRWMAAYGLAVGTAFGGSPGAIRFGCQLRTFGQGVYKDTAEFERLVLVSGELGFAGIETNWRNLERYAEDPSAFTAQLRRAGLALAGAHIGGSPWAANRDALVADVARAARFVKAVGGDFIVFSGHKPPGKATPAEGVPEMARFLNEIGGVCAEHGVRLLYHNHWWDCEDGILQRLAVLTDAGRVGFAFDTGHALRVGVDPVAVIEALGPRLALVHFADFSESDSSTVKRPPLGRGVMDLPAVAAAMRRAGSVRWAILEEESSDADGRTLAEQGLAAMRKAFGFLEGGATRRRTQCPVTLDSGSRSSPLQIDDGRPAILRLSDGWLNFRVRNAKSQT